MKYQVENIASKPIWLPGGVKLLPGKLMILDINAGMVKHLDKTGMVELTKCKVVKKSAKKDTKTGKS
jgi:hypothetical protein